MDGFSLENANLLFMTKNQSEKTVLLKVVFLKIFVKMKILRQ